VRICRDTARNGDLSYRYSLRKGPLSWVRNPGLTTGGGDPPFLPSIKLETLHTHEKWTWERSLLDCGPLSSTFTLTPERYLAPDPSRGLMRNRGQSDAVWQEYD